MLPQQLTLDCVACFPAAGFILYDSHIPKQLLDSGGPRTNQMDINNTLGHFDLVNYQLKEVGLML